MKLFVLMLALTVALATALFAQTDSPAPALEELGDFDDFADEPPASPYHAGDFFGYIEEVLTARLDHYASLRGEPLDRPENAPPGWHATLTHPAVLSAIIENHGFHALIGKYHDRESAQAVYDQLKSALPQFALSFSPLSPTDVRRSDPVPAMTAAAWESPPIDGYKIYYGIELDGDFELVAGEHFPRRIYVVRLHIFNLQPQPPTGG